MSRNRVVRDFIKGKLDAIPDWSFKVIPGGRAFIERPDSYPGGTLSLEISRPVEKIPRGNTYWRRRELTGVVLLYASSDGARVGDADALAWDGADLVCDALDGQDPTGLLGDDITMTCIETGDIEPFVIDDTVYGVMVPITCEMWWTTYV